MIFLKIGGGLITDKKIPFSVKWDEMARICSEIAEIARDKKILLGHGGGSFGHYVAREYENKPGGFARIREAMAKLSLLFTSTLIAKNVNAVVFPPSSFMVVKEKVEVFAEPLRFALSQGFVPVVHGDAILSKEGYEIFSTERVFREIARSVKPEKVLIATNTPVMRAGEEVKRIDDTNIEEIFDELMGSSGIDVTGGMQGKVLEAAKISAMGIEVRIFDGRKKGALKKALNGEIGTEVRVKNEAVLSTLL